MDTWKFYDITHREHVICNPTSEEKLTRLVELLRLPPRAQVVDIACGKGEFLMRLAEAVEERLASIPDLFTVAVMGCEVNGPGEARGADIGIAGGAGKGIIFRRGVIVRTVRGGPDQLLEGLMDEINIFLQERNAS